MIFPRQLPDSPASWGGTTGDEQRIHVVTSCDEAYLTFTAVLASSLAASRAPSTSVELTILQPQIGSEARSRLEECAPGIVVNWVNINEETYRSAGLELDPEVLRPHYFRVLVGTVLPQSVRRCIYLDGDTLVRRDLWELWATDLHGTVIGAALDFFLPRSGDAIGPWRELGIDPNSPYFNSGVMVIDLEAWRADDVGARVISSCIRHRAHLLAQDKWPQHDQFGLNVVLHHRWHRIPQTWNYLSEMPLADPHVVHFCGGGKPGSPTCHPTFSSWFAAALDQTAWRHKG